MSILPSYRTMCRECEWAGCDVCGGTGYEREPDLKAGPIAMPTKLGETIHAYFATMAANLERGATDPEQLSPAEVALAAALFEHKMVFEQQYPVGPYFVDFFFPESALAVEVDGREYHQDAEKDAHRTEYLLDHGVRSVLRLRAIQVFTDPLACMQEISRELSR